MLQGLLDGDPFIYVYVVGAHLDSADSEIVGQAHVFFGPINVTSEYLRIDGVVFKGAAQPYEFDRRVGKALLDIGSFSSTEADFDPVGVRRPQLNSGKTGFFATGNQRL